jgi:hypothetical protein
MDTIAPTTAALSSMDHINPAQPTINAKVIIAFQATAQWCAPATMNASRTGTAVSSSPHPRIFATRSWATAQPALLIISA